MGALFGGGSVQAAPAPAAVAAPVKKVAPTGPQLAPGQSVPGGPVGPVKVETEEERRNRLLRSSNTVLGDSTTFSDAPGNAVGGPGSDGVGSGTGETY